MDSAHPHGKTRYPATEVIAMLFGHLEVVNTGVEEDVWAAGRWNIDKSLLSGFSVPQAAVTQHALNAQGLKDRGE